MRSVGVAAVAMAVMVAGACTDRGSVTFQVDQPGLSVFNPVSTRLSEYELQTADGTLVAVANVAGTGEALLPLGALQITPAPEDMVMSLFSGSQLLGMARIRDVVIQKEQQKTYDANVRKPLVFVGAALPAETLVGNAVGDGQIFDFTVGSEDLEHPKMSTPNTPKMPDATAAAAVTSDGTLLLAGRDHRLTIFDTGSGSSMDLPLSFSPIGVAVAARDAAAVIVDGGDGSGGALTILHDLASLHDGAGSPQTTLVKLSGVSPRTAVFSADGQMIYVLSGGTLDPCEPGAAMPAANTLTLVTTDGEIKTTWMLPDFVSDVAVAGNGAILLSRSTANQVAKLVPGADNGMPAPQKLFDATCPTALRVSGNQIVAVTSALDADFNFTLLRGSVDGSPPAALALGAPTYNIPTETTTPTPGQPTVSVTVFAKTLSAYEMAVTPDGQRAVFASRIRYHQAGDHFTFLDTDCTATLDAVEYGLYIVDTSSGNATYEPRSLVVTNPSRATDACLDCNLDPFPDLTIPCPSGPGDRAVGLAAIFGGP